METVIIVIIVAVSTTVTPIIVSIILNTQHRKEKIEDYLREDAVADRLEKANRAALEASQSTLGKLDIIHTLVNSNLTQQYQAQLEATSRELVALREIARLHTINGQEPSTESISTIQEAESRISELRAILIDRGRQDEKASKQKNDAEQRGVKV